ncbi:diacylglycerol kinase [Desulfuromonas versatilis]|uniref:Diacylglycerol kinase n=1 Tax=Desulfuromonas versatilis TaxID=2802975 RepID=A0ABM8HSF7_9BACT|nr:diacylglycerol kinase [Desulfuromonas versatilis]BCR05220.1 diacylglycerol kinase [Desulfuromonas versatilis]
MKNDRLKPNGWLEAVNCAIEGILWTVRSQRHMRFHFFAAVGVILLALQLKISALEFVLLGIAVTMVMLAELLNTALEALVDLVSPDYHPLARRAKDVAAGAVLVASIGAVVIGYLALSRYFLPGLQDGFSGLGPAPGLLPVISVLAVVILVVLLKSCLGRGTPLHGGMPSGHSAVAFSIGTSVVLARVDLIIGLLALAMAAMVSHSRLLLGIHSRQEVLAGAGLGAAVTLALHLLFA